MTVAWRAQLAVAAALSAAAMLAPAGASAHGEGRVSLTAVVQSVSPAVPGLSVEALRSVAPALDIRNRTAAEVVVLGEAGEPFLRIGERGVFGNRRSPTLRRSSDPLASPRSAPSASGAPPADGDPPDWQRLHPGGRWRFFDPRLRVEPDGEGARLPFAIPLLVGTRRAVVRGFVQAGEIGRLRSTLDRAPARRGLELRLLDGPVPALFVRNETGRVLEVPGLQGEPFLRIGPGGVEANVRSPSLYRSGAQGVRDVPREADPRAAPVWRRLSVQPAWAWLERRARVPAARSRPFVLGSRAGTVGRWRTPMRLGGRALAVSGRLHWIPARAGAAREARRGDAGGWAVPAGLAALLALAGAARRRRLGRGRPGAANAWRAG